MGSKLLCIWDGVGGRSENIMDNLAKEHWIVYVNKSRWFSPSYYVYCSRCLNGGLHMDAITGEPILEDFCTYCYADMKEKDVEWKILSE